MCMITCTNLLFKLFVHEAGRDFNSSKLSDISDNYLGLLVHVSQGAHHSRLKGLHLITALSVHVFNTQKVILDTVTSSLPEQVQGCQPHTSSSMENMTFPASNNKAPCRGVPSRSNSRVQWAVGGGGGENDIPQYEKRRYTFQISLSESQ